MKDPEDDIGRAPARPSLAEALRFWIKLGFISFGGPREQIAIMHTELAEKKKWVGEARFLHALNSCMLLPGRRRSSSPLIWGGCGTRPGAGYKLLL